MIVLKFIWKYLQNLLLSLDMFVNAIFFGDPEETISSRIGKRVNTETNCKPCEWICWMLNKIDDRHCRKYINVNQGRGSDDNDELVS
jgi:hypothetical protein